MEKENPMHTFHIPVMGTGFTIDTPVKVAPYGISSVVSLVDDMLMEKLRGYYAKQFQLDHTPISDKESDHRARRITAYLDQLNEVVQLKFRDLTENVRNMGDKAEKYFNMLPQSSDVSAKYHQLMEEKPSREDISGWISKYLNPGNIDVNIMTKLDKENYDGDKPLPVEYNDAHAALRGFANSSLESSVIFSAGMNPKLFTYAANFPDFFPDEEGRLKKQIVLKVSDYRSAMVQGKMLAKKGLWVSEFRIESGLNCGGHAFATEGHLLGPVMETFLQERENMKEELHSHYLKALTEQGRRIPEGAHPLRITVQGGVGTSAEHDFLRDYYGVDSVGWGTPFLLVPEAVNVEDYSLNLLKKAGEEDLYLSDVSPLGVPFNNLRGNSRDLEKEELITKGRPGSSCPKKYVSFNKEFTEQPICTASREYQHKKLQELEQESPDAETYEQRKAQITEKSCICTGLGNAALIKKNLDTRREGQTTSICPGPNMAYYSGTATLSEMVQHIYGRQNLVSRDDRPQMFVKELGEYLKWYHSLINETPSDAPAKEQKRLKTIKENLLQGIEYYKNLFTEEGKGHPYFGHSPLSDLEAMEHKLLGLEPASTSGGE